MAFGLSAGAAMLVGSVAAPVIGGLMADDNGAQGLNDASAAASRQQAVIAQDQWDRWKKLYAPEEENFLNESRGTGSIANQNRNAQQAAADVASGFSKVREQINDVPVTSADARLREENRINLTEAATSAAAQSGARESTRAAGRAATTDALSLGRNLPANASSTLGSAASGMASAAQWGQKRADATAGGIGKMVGGITQSKAFQDWVGSRSSPTGVSTSVIPAGVPASASEFGGGGVMDDLQSYGVF